MRFNTSFWESHGFNASGELQKDMYQGVSGYFSEFQRASRSHKVALEGFSEV